MEHSLHFVLWPAFLLLFVYRKTRRLGHIPGPWTARILGLHELFHNIFKDGQWSQTFAGLHKRYNSPIVLVGPNHVHVHDIEIYEIIYHLTTNFFKDGSFYTAADNNGSIFSLSDHDEHRGRRRALAPRFSKHAAELAEPRIRAKLKDLLDYMALQSSQGEKCNIADLFRSLAINWGADVLLGPCDDLVSYSPRKPDMLEDIDGLSALVPTLQYFPYLATVNSFLPGSLADKLTPAGVRRFKMICEDHTRPLLDAQTNGQARKKEASVVELLAMHRLERDGKPPTLDYLADEAFTFIDAGVDTTGGTLVTAVYHILKDQAVLNTLRRELDDATGKDAGTAMKRLGELPYLNAIIKESHRIWPAIPGVLPRVVPPEGLQVGSYFVPGGTVISASHYALHYDETVFPEPGQFRPERWLTKDKWDGDRYLNPYSRGTRACIGINLAQMQLRLTLSYLFSHYDLQLCDAIARKRGWRDHFVAHPREPVWIRIAERV